MGDLIDAIGWRGLLTLLALPPVPWLLMLAGGLWWRPRRPLLGAALLALAVLGLWFSQCRVTGDWLQQRLLQPPPALAPADLAALKRQIAGQRPVIVVLGADTDRYAPEYGEPMLGARALSRLHYAVWLSRRLDVPLLYTGGGRPGDPQAGSEAAVAARVAERDLGRPLRWVEPRAGDTRGNARFSLPLLSAHGAGEVLLVTHAWHMPRALRAFQQAADLAGLRMRFVAAPMDTALADWRQLSNWLPSADGHQRVRDVLREALALLVGA